MGRRKEFAVVMPSGAKYVLYGSYLNANENYSEFIGKELVKIIRRMFPLFQRRYIYLPGDLWEDTVIRKWSEIPYHTFGYIAGLSSAMILGKMGTADDSSPINFEKKFSERIEIYPDQDR